LQNYFGSFFILTDSNHTVLISTPMPIKFWYSNDIRIVQFRSFVKLAKFTK